MAPHVKTGHRLGIDIGGTFTDFSVWDEATGRLLHHKAPTVPSELSAGVRNGMNFLKDRYQINASSIEYFVHGTTIGVNTVLQRNGADLALLVTSGFRDILELQRLRLADPVNYRATAPEPLIPRWRVFEIRERILADGTIDTELDRASVEDALERALALKIAGLAVCLINAYRNPAHETAVREIVRQRAPDLYVCCSHEVWPQMREYERATVTVLNAYIRPKVSGYLESLKRNLAEMGLRVEPLVTKSNGGVMPVTNAQATPVDSLLSGPASGVVGAIQAAGLSGFRDLLTLDIGGTSADIAVVRAGEPTYSREEHVGDFPLIMPAVAISSIGAGGGSIARIDTSGLLKVGPASAGANPGPACYARGGVAPTLTDAFLVSGFLNPNTFAGGQIKLSPKLAEDAVSLLGISMESDCEATADAIIAVAASGMYAEFSQVLTRHGVDPRDFTLVAFGGAGPLLACHLAEEFHIARVLIPQSPGTLCALGALSADLKNDYVRTLNLRLSEDRIETIRKCFAELAAEAGTWVKEDAPEATVPALFYSADMRYHHQAYEIELPIDPHWLVDATQDGLLRAFHALHERLYAHADPDEPVDLVDIHVIVVGAIRKPNFPRLTPGTGTPIPIGRRRVRLSGRVSHANVYRRLDLQAGQLIAAPAIVEQDDTTVVVPVGFEAVVDGSGNIVITNVE